MRLGWLRSVGFSFVMLSSVAFGSGALCCVTLG